MPRFDGTGPLGQGPMTGRGMGYCNVNYPSPVRNFWGFRGFGFGMRRGFMNGRRWFGRGFRFGRRFW